MFAAFHIAGLPIAAALREQPEWRERPCGILRESTGRDDGKIPLLALNSAARHTGIFAGWPLARALVRCPDLKILSRHPQTEAAMLSELIVFADSFTPDVEIVSPDTLLLDLSATPARATGDFEMISSCCEEACHALAETPDLARLAVLEPSTRGRFVSTDELGRLPLSLLGTLDGGDAFLPLLELLGIRTLQDYRRLPRQDLAERFGSLAGHWHDLVSGKYRRLLRLYRPPESLAQSMDFDDAIHSSEALVFIFNRLLHVLSSRLAARHVAASVLEIRLKLEEGEMRREIHLPEPLTDPSALLKPIQTFAESLVLKSPVTGVELNATAAFPLSRQSDWTNRQLPRPELWADTMARLEALLGENRVGIPVPLPSHRPDTFEMRAPNHAKPVAVDSLPPRYSIPLRRYRPPLNVAVAFDANANDFPKPLALLTGPHCGEILEQLGPFPTSGGGWNPDGSWRRIEWDIRIDRAPILRLVYHSADRWQLEGAYT
ncbi:MAG: DNA polymerase Y family protein [Luteolibacter sp.]|uniref:DNA polymerase Y family protein n=1 Tax=Luteolibacter sp. TaxID=1962973 RepID=UPI003267E444